MPVSNHTPSWKQGYARNAAQSAAPGLWKGLAGLWVPGLGPTGLTLRDISGFDNDGTLTNMDPATDWVTTGQRGIPWGLIGFSHTEYITLPSALVSLPANGNFTIALWAKTGTIGAQDENSTALSFNGPDDLIFYIEGSAGLFRIFWRDVTGSISAPGVLNTLEWNHVALVSYGDTDHRMFANGRQVLTDTSSRAGAGPFTSVALGNWIGSAAQQYADGTIGGCTFYNRALAPSEIQKLHEKPMDMLRRLIQTLPAEVAVAGTILPQITSAYLRTNA